MGNDRTVKMPGARKRRIPVGKAVYPALRRGDYVYVDKTGFIPLLEALDSTYTVLQRPRRLGKSFFMSMLECRRPLKRSWTTPVGSRQRTPPPKTSARCRTSKRPPSSSSGRR